MRFGIITDIHFTAGQDKETLCESVLGWQESGAAFAVQLGDLIAGDPLMALDELKQAKSVLDRCRCTIRHVIGNHCLAVPEDELVRYLGMERAYYAFTEDDYRFIVLHGMDISVFSRPRTAEDLELLEWARSSPGLHDYCGAIGKVQKAWLKDSLEKAEKDEEKVIILSHFPLLPETTDLKHGLLWNHRDISELILSSTAVKACFSGHFHHGAHTVANGIHFIVLPAFVDQGSECRFTSGTVELAGTTMVVRDQQNKKLLEVSLE
ncbi:MAG: metallophosphoesterase [Chlorobiaceae bacterium]|nr:metallophosphoesterase [Chlorobiaceae bacterium]NTV60710.1 metallophosphoesterase [Chlorobiaceae bacterium]